MTDFLIGPDGKYIASGGTQMANFLESGARLISGLFGNGNQVIKSSTYNTLLDRGSVSLNGQRIVNELSSEGRATVSKALGVLRTGDGLLFGGIAIDTQAKRSQVESMFVNLAFALASTREGGKLTDNDVKNALITLGWTGNSWTQTPEAIVATLKNSIKEATNDYVAGALIGMSDPDAAIAARKVAEGHGDVGEQLLRRIASGSDPEAAKMYRLYQDYAQPDDKGNIPKYRLSFHLNKAYHDTIVPSASTDGAESLGTDGTTTFQFLGQPIITTSTLNEHDLDVLTILENQGTDIRSVDGLSTWLNTLDPAVKARYQETLKKLRDHTNFFDMGGP